MIYKHTTHNIHNREDGRKEEQSRTWVSSKRKKEEVSDTFVWFSVLQIIVSVYQSEIPTQPRGTLTRPLTLANSASGSTGPSSSLSSRLSLVVTFPRLLLTAGSVNCPGTLPSLVFFRSRMKSSAQAFCVGFAPKQTKEFSDWNSPTPTGRMHPHRTTDRSDINMIRFLLAVLFCLMIIDYIFQISFHLLGIKFQLVYL